MSWLSPRRRHNLGLAAGALLCVALLASAQDKTNRTDDKVLFDFADEGTAKDWKPVKLPELKKDEPAPKIDIVPAPKSPGASGKCLQITFNGGDWPTIGTTKILISGNWQSFNTLKADLTVDRPSTAYFRVYQARKTDKIAGRTEGASCWERTMTLLPGRNEVILQLRLKYNDPNEQQVDPKKGDVTWFIIGMFQPEKGQTLQVANVRLSASWPPYDERKEHPGVDPNQFSPYGKNPYSTAVAREFGKPGGGQPKFKILDDEAYVRGFRLMRITIKSAPELDYPNESVRWLMRRDEVTIEQLEAEYRAEHEKIKKTHPKAVLVMFREGDKGCNPANPDRLYVGWKATHIRGAKPAPDGPDESREMGVVAQEKPLDFRATRAQGFSRYEGDRGILMQADLTSIPKGATILAAKLALRSVNKNSAGVLAWWALPCNREWEEAAANSYFFAKGKRWKAVNGVYYGADPDFLPIILGYTSFVNGDVFDMEFKAAMKMWVDGKHANHGFLLQSGTSAPLYTHRAKEIKRRPMLMVIYEPKS
jgi:hypothetical protein